MSNLCRVQAHLNVRFVLKFECMLTLKIVLVSGSMFALFSCFSTGEIIRRVEDRVRLRVRLRVAFRVGLQEADSGLCCLVGPCLLEVDILRRGSLLCSLYRLFFRFIAVLCFNPFTAICFLRDKLYFGFCVVISASLTLTFAK